MSSWDWLVRKEMKSPGYISRQMEVATALMKRFRGDTRLDPRIENLGQVLYGDSLKVQVLREGSKGK
ncbi:MAG: hypothetical protein ABH867_01810 [Patescibacteria group bacterium]|nr:hypothetical protein [Patescibacteria group bacterium]